MKRILCVTIIALILSHFLPASAGKKCNVDMNHPTDVRMTGVASNGYFIKAWAIAKNADKAIAQARIDALLAALRNGIAAERGAGGTTSLPALMTGREFDDHRYEIACMLASGELNRYLKDVSSTYPKGADNIKTPAGRKVGLSMVLDYSGLRRQLRELGWIKDLNDHFEYNTN